MAVSTGSKSDVSAELSLISKDRPTCVSIGKPIETSALLPVTFTSAPISCRVGMASEVRTM